ncbi:MAG: hypothetical protein ABR520_10280 [Mycobacteriales bacterium]|nr:hypothetical protein [Frankia sp.]
MITVLTVVSVSVVPLTWWLGIAAPWPEVRGRELHAVALGALYLSASLVGVLVAGRSKPNEATALAPASSALNSTLVWSLLVGMVGLFVLLAAVGGGTAALANLTYRRTFFAGLGPLVGIAFVPGLALPLYVAALGRETLRPLAHLLAAACLLAFTAAVVFTGEKANVVNLLLLCGVFRVRGGNKVPAALVVVVLLLFVPLSTYYQYEVRQRRSVGQTQGTIDTGGIRPFLRSTWGPFAESGLDQLRTLEAASDRAPLVSLASGGIANGPLTLVPRRLWPGKPDSSALRFAKAAYPSEWESGTGIPPSLMAEMVFNFGLAGGYVVLVALCFVLASVDRAAARHRGLLVNLLYAAGVVGVFIGVKAGTDSGLRIFVLYAIPAVIVSGIASLLGQRAIHE